MLKDDDVNFLKECWLKGVDNLNEEECSKFLILFEDYKRENGIYFYKPIPKVIPFHQSEASRRLIHGANRSSKTYSGAAEMVWMATCTHPYKNTEPDEYWVVSESYAVQKDSSQKTLMELLPQSQITKTSMIKAGVIETIYIDVVKEGKRVGESKISFKSSDSGVRAFAGAAKRGIWFDEEPPFEVFQEAVARIGAGKDLSVWLTMTPIFEQRGYGNKTGMSWTYREIYQKRNTDNVFAVGVGIEDNIYLSKDQIEEQKKKYKGVEYDIRIKGEYRLISGLNVFDAESLEYYYDLVEDPIFRGYLDRDEDGFKLTEAENGVLKIWEKPKHRQKYYIGADIGLGIGGDSTCAVVLDKDLKQVAELHGQIPPDKMALMLKKLGLWYNSAYIGIEANSFGISCIDHIKKDYTNLYQRYQVDRRSDVRTKKIGWWTDTHSKPIMVGDFKQAISERTLQIPSKAIVDELMTYIMDSGGSPNAEKGCHDDRVIAIMIALQVRKKHLIDASEVQQESYVPSNRLTGY